MSLAIVPQTTPPESVSKRVQRLQRETKALAREHVAALVTALTEVERLAAEISTGGDCYAAGIRDLSRRLSEDCGHKGLLLQSLAGRS